MHGMETALKKLTTYTSAINYDKCYIEDMYTSTALSCTLKLDPGLVSFVARCTF